MNTTLKNVINYLENKSKKYSIILYGIPESGRAIEEEVLLILSDKVEVN